jgi:hypothetical protein
MGSSESVLAWQAGVSGRFADLLDPDRAGIETLPPVLARALVSPRVSNGAGGGLLLH